MSDELRPIPPLEEALATFLATRSSYLTAAEQAHVTLLLALARQLQAGAPPASALPVATTPDAPGAELLAELRLLRAEVAELRRAQQLLDPGEELARLRAELAELRRSQVDLSSAMRTLDRPSSRGQLGERPPAPSAYPTEARSLDYWAENIPDFGEDSSPAELKAAVERPRVRPEDIVVTEAELSRQTEIQRRARLPHQSSARARAITIVVVIVVVFLLYVVFAALGANLGPPR